MIGFEDRRESRDCFPSNGHQRASLPSSLSLYISLPFVHSRARPARINVWKPSRHEAFTAPSSCILSLASPADMNDDFQRKILTSNIQFCKIFIFAFRTPYPEEGWEKGRLCMGEFILLNRSSVVDFFCRRLCSARSLAAFNRGMFWRGKENHGNWHPPNHRLSTGVWGVSSWSKGKAQTSAQ